MLLRHIASDERATCIKFKMTSKITSGSQEEPQVLIATFSSRQTTVRQTELEDYEDYEEALRVASISSTDSPAACCIFLSNWWKVRPMATAGARVGACRVPPALACESAR